MTKTLCLLRMSHCPICFGLGAACICPPLPTASICRGGPGCPNTAKHKATVYCFGENPELPPCKYGKGCYRTNPDHRAKYGHPPLELPPCKHGKGCYQTNPDHRDKYGHPPLKLPPCKYGADCYHQTDPVHSAMYGHP